MLEYADGALSNEMVNKYYNMDPNERKYHPLAKTQFYLVVHSDGTMIRNTFVKFLFNSGSVGYYFKNYWFAYAYQLRVKQRLKEPERL